MAEQNRHIIQKQVLEVEMENPADAFQFRNRLGEVYHEKILPRLERLFDEYGDNRLIRIDDLQVDVGDIATANWEDDLAEKAVSKIRQALLLQNPLAIDPPTNNDTVKTQDAFSRKEDNSIAPNYTSQKFAELFFFFLKTGQLPWFAPRDFDLQAFKSWITDQSFSNTFHAFLTKASDAELLRLIYQFDEATLEGVIAILLPGDQSAFYKEVLANKAKLTTHFIQLSLDKASRKRVLLLPMFRWFSVSQNMALENFYVEQLLNSLRAETSLDVSIICEGLIAALAGDKNAANKSIDRQVKPTSLLLAKLKQFHKSTEGLGNVDAKSTEAKQEQEQWQEHQDQQEQHARQDQQEQRKQQDITDEIYVQNAGLVLLHPFLTPFFQALGFLNKENHFIDKSARMKAVLLTQYLTTGEQIFYEQHLPLNKILCGMQMAEPIITELELTDKNFEEANDLLAQVITLWKKNNVQVNATVEGLRSSFLMRQGKLVQMDKGWKLQVEQKPYDMVLSALPWGFSIIKNSWMEGMLWVEWT